MSSSLFWKPAPLATADHDQGPGLSSSALATDYSRNAEDCGSSSALYAAASNGTSRGSGRKRRNNNNNNNGGSGGRPSLSRSLLAQQQQMLPIHKHKRQIQYALEAFGVVVIVGETGSGKSTQIPQYLLEAGWAGNANDNSDSNETIAAPHFQVLCTQPRRIAAITLAGRVAEETGGTVGGTVGYTVRFDDRSSEEYTQIKYVTDGVLVREATISSDPLLSRYSVIMVDEAHERNLQSDAVLALLKKIRRKRPSLRVIVCSATIDAQSFLDFFVGKSDAQPGKQQDDNDGNIPPYDNKRGTIISVDGRQHSVDMLYLAQPAENYIRSTVETVKAIHLEEQQGSGDILCFLPSGEDVDAAIRLAEEHYFASNERVDFLPLYGTLPLHMQARVFETTAAAGISNMRRRVIFATNIAETSVTVPNIAFVVDSGLVKLPYFDPSTGLERLIVGPTSQAGAQQRAGRAGRVRSGKCYRLYTENFLWNHMQAQTPPEILRTNLTSFILTLKALGVDNILAFDLMDVPSIAQLSHGLESLYALGAMDDDTNLTTMGLDMSSFPTEPRVSRMLLEGISRNCAWEVLAVAAALQVRQLFYKPYSGSRHSQQQQKALDYEAAMLEISDPSGDHVTFANLLAETDDQDLTAEECKERFINHVALRRAVEIRDQLSRFLRRFGRVQAMGLARGTSAEDGLSLKRSKAIRQCVTTGFFFNVAKLGNDGRYYTLRKHNLVTPSPSSVLSLSSSVSLTGISQYIVFGESVDGARGGIEIRHVSNIEARWLRELAPHYWE